MAEDFTAFKPVQQRHKPLFAVFASLILLLSTFVPTKRPNEGKS